MEAVAAPPCSKFAADNVLTASGNVRRFRMRPTSRPPSSAGPPRHPINKICSENPQLSACTNRTFHLSAHACASVVRLFPSASSPLPPNPPMHTLHFQPLQRLV